MIFLSNLTDEVIHMNKLTKEQQELIYQTISLNGKKIVLLLDENGLRKVSIVDLNANIFCIDDSFEIIWRINAEPTKFKQDPFTSIKSENGEIQTKRFSGFKYKINIETGEAEIISWDK